MGGEPPVRIGLRVDDVGAALELYERFGFVPVGVVPAPGGRPVMAIARRGPLQLLVDALEGLPFPDTERERHTVAGPRGLGVVIGIAADAPDDVDELTRRAAAAGCVVGAGPADAPWGERYAEVVDPYGYTWKFFRVFDNGSGDGLDAAREHFRGA
ncbi:VOC family protein [Dactylosporangium sp. CA-139066]|uniref:VOC family protein n=1 Tax=Dactylosporangium sp. CA-139066 TaxID=3239930 RepID=UPI003D8C5976